MSSQKTAFPITREDFEGKQNDMKSRPKGWISKEVGKEMADIKYGDGRYDSLDLWDIILTLDDKDDFLPTDEEREVLNIVRDSMSIFHYTYNEVLAPKVGITSEGIEKMPDKKARFLYTNTHALHFASAYALSNLERIAAEKNTDRPNNQEVKTFAYNIDVSPSTQRKYTLGKLASSIKEGKAAGTMKDGKDLLNFAITYFKKVQEAVQLEKEKYKLSLKNIDGNGLIVADLENTTFDIEGVKFTGFNYESPMSVKAPKIEVKDVHPEDVVGNRHAKKLMMRDIERLVLFDFIKKRNPILEFDALTWSALLDGLPGTGKTTMMQMEMTYLKKLAEQLDIPFAFWIIDAAEKNEFYGKTQQLYRAKLDATLNTGFLNLVYFDDVDLIIPGRQSGNMNSADQDTLKLFMDYLAGAYTIFRGNTIARAATNSAASLDSAFRQRFEARYLIDGPTTAQDAAKLMMIKFRKQIKNGIIDLPLGKGLDVDDLKTEERYALGDTTLKILKRLDVKSNGSGLTWMDVGNICKEYQKIDSRFTGRFINNVQRNVIVASADFDLDPEIFKDRKVFFDKTYEEKVDILKGQFKPINQENILQEMDRYFESEIRYMRVENEGMIKRAAKSLMSNIMGTELLKRWSKEEKVNIDLNNIEPD